LREGGIKRYPENINTRHLQERREREREKQTYEEKMA
jgi:hypothetical protein